MRLFTTLVSSRVRSVVAKTTSTLVKLALEFAVPRSCRWLRHGAPSLRDVSSADRRRHGHDVSYGEAREGEI